MTKFATTSFLLILLLSTAACAPVPGAVKREARRPSLHEQHPEYRESERNRDREAFAASDAAIDVESYDFDAFFDWDRNEVQATTTIKLKRADAQAPSLALDASLTEVFMARANGRAVSFSVDADNEKLVLDVTALAGQTELEIQVRYRAEGTASRGVIRAIGPRAGDPMRSRVVYTHSEPQGARAWMPCHDDPSDRAQFRARFTLPDGERFIANGAHLGDEATGDGVASQARPGFRRSRYATRNPIPTYVMAWAAGEMQASETQHGALPVAIWSRKGLPADVNGLLAETVRQIKHFERLVGPYPHEKYAIVLLPDMGGGEENVSITFNDEAASSQALLTGDRSLMAHELGHQWFGDYMTVSTWDDLWIKEGMATLLAAEATRPFEDLTTTGRLFGSQFWAVRGEAVRDPQLPPGEKYTSGPYDRAAWVLTQIRATVGEDVFWSTLRQVLRTHAHGSITTEEFLAFFLPSLGQVGVEQVRRAVHAHEVPGLELSVDAADATKISLRVLDPEQILIAPLELSRLRADGSVQSLVLSEQAAPLPSDGLLVQDPRDVHPEWFVFLSETGLLTDEQKEAMQALFGQQLAPLALPRTDSERAVWLDNAGPRTQWSVLEAYGAGWLPEGTPSPLSPASFAADLRALDGEGPRYLALQAGCRALLKDAANAEAWRVALKREFLRPSLLGLSYPQMSSCSEALGPDFLAEPLALLAAEPTSPLLNEVLVDFLAHLTLSPERTLATWEGMAFGGPTYRTRATALRHLSRGLARARQGTEASEPLIRSYNALFRRALESSVTYASIRVSLGEVLGSESLDALPSLGRFVRTLAAPSFIRVRALCGARKIADKHGFEASWPSFRDEAAASESLEPELRRLLADPSGCDG
jgi:aminopeptidase N